MVKEKFHRLYEISRAVNSSLDLKTVLQLIMDITTDLFKADAGSIMLLQNDRHLTIEVSRGLEQAVVLNTRVPIGQGIAGWVAEHGEPLLLDGQVREARFKTLVPRGEMIRSSLCVPLKVKDSVIGVLILRNPTSESHFTEEHLRFLCAIADHASMAIVNARLYQETKRRVEEMVQLSEVKNRVISMVTHDLKTPLTSIQGFVEMILTRHPSPETMGHYLDIVQQETARLIRLVNGVLEFASFEAGGLKLVVRPIFLDELIRSVIPTFALRSSKHEIIFTPLTQPTKVLADSDMITRVLDNLLSNAMKYSPVGGEIRISSRVNGNFVEVDIEDQGIGIPAEKLSQLFEPFFRVSSPATKSIRGTGLGLANVKYIVEAHGGLVAVKSKEGKGSVFTFSLPKARE